MNKLSTILFILLLTLLLGGCQTERQTYAALEQLLETTFAADGPGVVLLVDSPVSGEHILATGLSDLTRGRAIQSKSHLRIGDMTKTFVSTLVFQLVEEGEIALDDTLDRHFAPEIVAGLPNGSAITIRQLLNMSSGLPDYRDNPAFVAAMTADPVARWSPEKLVAYAYELPPQQPPGAGYAYANTNYLLLHMLIEDKLDELLAEELRDRVLDILDMPDTYLEIAEDLPVGYVPGYADLDGDGALESTLGLGDARGLGDMGLISNVLDLAKFAPALYARSFTGENGRSESLATLPMPGGDAYGLGIMRRDSPWGPMWGHDNAQPGFSGQMWYLPDHETTLILLSNGIPNDRLAPFVNQVLAVVLGSS